MAVYFGRGTNVRVGREVTWGTALATGDLTHTHRIVSTSVKLAIETAKRNTLEAQVSAGKVATARKVGGALVMELTYNSLGLLLTELMGAAPVTTGPSGGLYTHTWAIGADDPAGLTLEVNRGTSGLADVFSGVVPVKATWEVKPGDIPKVTWDVVGCDCERTTAGTPSYPSDLLAQAARAGTLAWNGDTFQLTSLKVVIDTKRAGRPQLGSLLQTIPGATGMMDVVMELELEWGDADFFAGWLAGDSGDAVISITSAAGLVWRFTLESAYVDDCSDPISGLGVIAQSVKLAGQSTAGAGGMEVTVINASSSAEAP